MQNTKIIIIGGGIAGLSAMRSLEMAGYTPHLVEKADKISSDGTAILLGINAVLALHKMGLEEELTRCGANLCTMTAFDEQGKHILSCDLEYVEAMSGLKTYGIQRESLSNMLLNSVNRENIRVGKSVKNIENTGTKAQVTFEDDTVESYDLVIGADGANSILRKTIFGDIPFRDAKQGCWRFIANTPDNFDKQGIYEYFGVGKRAGYMPLKDGKLYAYVLLNSDMYDKNNLPNNDGLLEYFQEFQGDWQSIANSVRESSKTIYNEIKDLSQICITNGNVVLIGDAAHAVTPNMGQGAAMGIEDGYILAEILKSTDDTAAALSAFEAKRYKRVKAIRDKSFMIGKIAQSSLAIFCKVRNAIYRLMSAEMVAKDTLKTLNIKL